jgi:hypothetical protein
MSRPFTVFYSWQSDLPNSINRSFIGDALRRAVTSLGDLEIAIDRDTQDMAGSPDISEAIFAKIEKADAFVCDVSIINSGAIGPDGTLPRPVPNPNVLIELGYAMRVLPWDRILLIVNDAYGPVESLPFDIKRKRALTYNLPLGEEKKDVRARFVATLAVAVKSIYDLGPRAEVRPSEPSLAQVVIQKVSGSQADASTAIRSLWKHWMTELEVLAPIFDSKLQDANVYEALLREKLEGTLELTREFGEIATVIADASADGLSQVLYDGFLPLIKRYDTGIGPNGLPRYDSILNCDADFFRFIGHEWFVMFVACLLRGERYGQLGKLLKRKFTFAPFGKIGEEPFPFPVIKQAPWLWFNRGRIFEQGALLKNRHQLSEVEDIVSWRELWEADYFLFLQGQLTDPHWNEQPPGIYQWIMWTASQIHVLPSWVATWRFKESVEPWLGAFSLNNVQDLQFQLTERKTRLNPSLSFQRHGASLHPELIAIQ